MSNYLNTQLYKRKVRDTTFMPWSSWKKSGESMWN